MLELVRGSLRSRNIDPASPAAAWLTPPPAQSTLVTLNPHQPLLTDDKLAALLVPSRQTDGKN